MNPHDNPLLGKVAVITGAARGQGRAHAVQLAQAGADIIAVDICHPIESMPYPMADLSDLQETVNLVERAGRRACATAVDVRNREALNAAIGQGVDDLGRIDIVIANAGISTITAAPGTTDRVWQDVIDTNLTGVWNTVEACLPAMRTAGRGGAIVLISSTAGLKGLVGAVGTPATLAYTASKHGVVGLMKAYANYLAPENIRVNTIHPSGVATPMLDNPSLHQYFTEHPDAAAMMSNALPVELTEPSDISSAALWLVADSGRYVTGVALPVDAGFSVL